MPGDYDSAVLTQKDYEAFCLESSARFMVTVAEVYRLLGFEVLQEIRLRGVPIALAVAYQGGGMRLPAVVMCLDSQVTEPACQRVLTCQVLVQRQFPDHRMIVVSSQGYAAESRATLTTAGIDCVTYGELLAELVPLDRYVTGLIADYEAWVREHWHGQYWFIRSLGWRDISGAPRPALEYLGQWLGDPQAPLLVLLGDSGTGKSTLTRFVAYRLAQSFRDDPVRHPAPVLLSLKDVRQACTLESLLVSHFSSCSLPDVRVSCLMHLVRLGKIILLCDAFDEMADRVRRDVAQAHLRQLQRAASPHSKILLTCRPHHWQERHEPGWMMGYMPSLAKVDSVLSHGQRQPLAATVVSLQAFDDTQIQLYLARARPQTAAADWRTIESMPDLKELAHQPFLLDLIVTALASGEIGTSPHLAHFYQIYTTLWIAREARQTGRWLTSDLTITLLRALAWRLWHSEAHVIPAREFVALVQAHLSSHTAHYDAAELFDLARELQTASFLRRSDDARHVAFRHRSLLEYFLACHVLENFPADDSVPEALRTRRLDHKVVTFLTLLDATDRLCAPLQRLLQCDYIPQVSENALQILYWSGRVRQGMEATLSAATFQPAALSNRLPVGAQLRGAQLQEMILEAADLREADCSGADLTGANLAQACLSGAHLQQAILTGAHLDEVLAEHTDFSHAQVAGASFTRARLTGSLFLGANVHEAIGLEIETYGTAGAHDISRLQTDRLQPVIQQGHTASVNVVAYSPDGTFLASGDDDGLIWLYQASNGQILQGLEGHHRAVRALAFAPTAPLLASGSMDGSVRLWDMAIGKPVWVLAGHADSVQTVIFNAHGTLLASGGADRNIYLWDIAQGTLAQVLEGHEDGVLAMAFTADGTLLASCSADRSLRVWDVAQGKLLRVFTGQQDWGAALTFAPNAAWLASGESDGSIRVWDVALGQAVRMLAGYQHEVRALAFAATGTLLAAGSAEGSIQLWDVARGEPVRVLTGHQREVRALAFAPQGALLASCSANRSVRLWDVGRGQPVWSLQGQQREVRALAFTPTGTLLAASSADGSMHLWDMARSEPVQVLQGQQRPVPAMAFAPNGILLAHGGTDRSIRLWDVTRGKLIRVLQGQQRDVDVVAFAPTGAFLAAGYLDGSMRLWDVVRGTAVWGLQGHQHGVAALAFAPQSTLLASGSADRSVRLWDVVRGQPLQVLQGHQAGVTALAFAPTGPLLAAGSLNGSVCLWDVAHAEPLQVLQGHRAGVAGLAFAPHGNLLASGGLDHSVCLWDMQCGELVRVLQGHGGPVYTLAFAANGKYLVASGAAGCLQFWDVDQGEAFLARYSFGPGAWLDVLPDGRFDASPAGRRFLGYTERGTLQAYRAEEVQSLFWDAQAVRAVLAVYTEQSPKEP